MGINTNQDTLKAESLIADSTAIIDCRSQQQYQQGHIQGATHIPVTQLFSRMHELPRRAFPINICVTADIEEQAISFLHSKGYEIQQVITWQPTLSKKLDAIQRLEHGAQSRQLWQAAPIIQHFIKQTSKQLNIAPGTGLDIACGSGRDMVYMAQHDWKMHGVDYLPDALNRAQSLAQNNQVSIQTYQQNLQNIDTPFQTLSLEQQFPSAFDFISVSRYLHRPLLQYLSPLLQPGGVLIYQTFMQGCEKISSPKNPHFLLRKDELRHQFIDLEIILDEVEHLDDGRPISRFIARKPL